LSINQVAEHPSKNWSINHFEYMRAVEKRYNGIPAGRVSLDHSSMVSAFFYPLNLTNPDQERAPLPRLPMDHQPVLEVLRFDLKEAMSRERSPSIDWQGIVDMIITRYSDRLKFLTLENLSRENMAFEIGVLLDVFINYKHVHIPMSIQDCSIHYLRSVTPKTPQDHLIHEAIFAVSQRICNDLFQVRNLLAEEDFDVAQAKDIVEDLISYLNWTTWLECGKCAYDEVCFVAIWPWGSPQDHVEPACQPIDQVQERHGYWSFP
jgi:hypothetical protein